MATKIPNVKLTVIIRNDAPYFHWQDNPAYRSVIIELTDKQKSKLALESFNTSQGVSFEEISQSFLEPANE